MSINWRKGVVGLGGALGFASSLMAADIAYVADGSTGEYCGAGYGISVNVSAPSSGYMIEYSEDGVDGWSATPLTYTDVCTDKPIYFRILAAGYETETGSAKVTVTPKTLTEDYIWGVYPPEDYVYDGTAKMPEAAFGDGDPSILTENDFEVTYENNVNAGTAKIIFTGKNNYTGVVEEEFEIKKASLMTDGAEPDEPGEEPGTVPEGGISKFDVVAVYDGEGHTIDAERLVKAFVAAMGEGTKVEYGVADVAGAVAGDLLGAVAGDLLGAVAGDPQESEGGDLLGAVAGGPHGAVAGDPQESEGGNAVKPLRQAHGVELCLSSRTPARRLCGIR